MHLNSLFQLPSQGYQSLLIETSGDLWTAQLDAGNKLIVGRGETPDEAIVDLKSILWGSKPNDQAG